MNRVVPTHRDKDGFMVSAKSGCCGANLVFFEKKEGIYVSWPGWGRSGPRTELRCYLCNEVNEIGGEDE